MIALVQRVTQAQVRIAGAVVGEIGVGLLVFVCAERSDTGAIAAQMVAKLLKLRVFADANDTMNRSLVDVGGGLLLVSQFTLAADVASGNRPSFDAAAAAGQGRQLYEEVVRAARASHPNVACGEFGADMQVHLVNDGPVTIPLTIRA